MNYESYYWGMNLVWWIVWIIIIAWIFIIPYDIPFQRTRKDSPQNILKNRLAHGHITAQEYHNLYRTLENQHPSKH